MSARRVRGDRLVSGILRAALFKGPAGLVGKAHFLLSTFAGHLTRLREAAVPNVTLLLIAFMTASCALRVRGALRLLNW